MKKILLIILAGVFALMLVAFIFPFSFSTIFHQHEMNKKEVLNMYDANSSEITLIAEYLLKSDCKKIVIWPSDEGRNEVILHLCDTLPYIEEAVDDRVLCDTIFTVFDSGCQVITKDDDCIYFQFASTLDDGEGILFLAHNGAPPEHDSSGYKLITGQIGAGIYYYRTDLNHSK